MFDNTDGADTDVLAGRAAFRAELTDSLQADLILDYSRKRGHAGLERLVNIDPSDPNLAFYNSFLVSQGLPPADERFITRDVHDTWSGSRNQDDNEMGGASLTLDWSGATLHFKSITAWRTLQVQSGYDFDGTPYPLAEQALNLDQEQISQEFQLSGDAFGGRLQWMTGLFYFGEDAQDSQDVPFYQPVIATGGGSFVRVPGGFLVHELHLSGNEQLCGLWSGNVPLQRQVVRHSGPALHRREETLDSYVTGAFVRPQGTVSDSWSDLSPRLGLEYPHQRPGDDLRVPLRGAIGSGAFNGRNTSPNPPQAFDPETIWAYELGLKTETDNRRLRFNSALFYYDYSDFQGPRSTASAVSPSPSATSPRSRCTVPSSIWLPVPPSRCSCPSRPAIPHHDIAEVASGSADHHPAGYAAHQCARWTATAAIDYTVPAGKTGDIDLHLDYGWKSEIEFFLPNYPDEGQDAYGVLNACVGFRAGRLVLVAGRGIRQQPDR